MMLAYKDRIVYSTGEMNLKNSQYVFNETANRQSSPPEDRGSGKNISLRLKVRYIIDEHDILQDMNPVIKWTDTTFIGHPGWFRFRADFTLKAVIDGVPSFIDAQA